MGIFKKSKKSLKNHIGSVSGDLNSAFSKLKSKFGSVGNFSNSFDQRISDGLSDLLTGATGIRTSNIPEISNEVLASKQKNREARAKVLNDAMGGRASDTPSKGVKLQFPESFNTENGDGSYGLTNYIHFRSLPLRNGKRGAVGDREDTLYDIFLYVPEEMTDGTELTYKAGEKSILESMIAKLFTLGEGTDQNVMGQVGQSVKEAVLGDVGKAAAGKVINPMKFQLFEGVEFRSFTYTFILYPKNSKDSEIIREIAYAFKYSSLPASKDRLYSFPNEFAIRYHGPIKKWMDFPMTSVLTKVETNQSTAGSARMVDGAPVATELSLTFQEVVTLDRGKYEKRVAAHTNQTGSNREKSQEGGSLDDIMNRRGTDVSLSNRVKDRVGMDAENRDGQTVDGEYNFNPFD